ncbi:EAL domain-containing response regulator [Pseudoalteromonas tunicata]|uniref:EAL domain-containing response regulator n=1 Tax=Pseudoalteromonas tunicata TaxID=314281 RepID=UPI00273FFD84|nr:EAL domain-containing response regulator [Pseudoalteromonas tunicata]MDP5212593.1 EAL domain-containing response regulator [Pseudoalteromonas tunicata]
MEIIKKPIVLIDDSPALLLILHAQLSQLGFKYIDTFTNAEAALKKIQSNIHFYAAVFTDLNMPKMDGMEFIRHLGKSQFNGGVIIVSEMDPKVISLASELAKENNCHLIGNIPKPIEQHKLKMLLVKLNDFVTKKENIINQMTESDLINAIKNGRLLPYYQPKISNLDNKVYSVEVLARISSDNTNQVIQPSMFIPTAEKYNLTDAFSFQLFNKAMADFKSLSNSFGPDLKMAINISPNQLTDFLIPEKIDELREQHAIEAKNIILEITEEYALKSNAQLETLNRLRMRGYSISLDDFGTGFTNLTQLRTLPFTEIKIDRSLIRDIHIDNFSQVVVNSLAQIAIEQHFTLVAEGIENFNELEYLQRHFKLEVLLQGYLICRPKPCKELITWHQNWVSHVLS